MEVQGSGDRRREYIVGVGRRRKGQDGSGGWGGCKKGRREGKERTITKNIVRIESRGELYLESGFGGINKQLIDG